MGKKGGSKQKYKKEDEESIPVAIEDRTTVPASQEKLHEVARCGGPRPGSFVANSLGNGEGWITTVIPSLYPPHKWVYPSPIRLRWIHPYPTRLSRMWIWATSADIHLQLDWRPALLLPTISIVLQLMISRLNHSLSSR